MAVVCEVFLETLSPPYARGAFAFAAVPAVGETIIISPQGRSPTAHKVLEVFHYATPVGGEPKVAIVFSRQEANAQRP
jgi:hypothetical protein